MKTQKIGPDGLTRSQRYEIKHKEKRRASHRESMRKLRSKKEHAEYMQEWKAANPDAVRSYSRKYYEKNKNSEEFKRKAADSGYKNRHGISLAQYEEILKSQNGCCKICKKERGDKRLHLDHDHKTGEIRGILCNTCNTKLGWFELYDKEIKEYLHR